MNPFRTKNGVQRTPVLAELPSARALGDGVVAMRLYEPIDSYGEFWGVSAKEFTRALDELPEGTTEIRLLINSPGGEVWEGMAILNALRAHPARVVAVVEGLAASSASFIACGVDELVMMRNSELFIHNAWAIVMGDAADLRAAADDLENHFDRNIASIYAAKSGDPVEHWLAEMHQDRFLTAEQAVTEKLADRIEGVVDAEAAKARFDLSALARTDRRVAAADTRLPSSSEPGEPNRKDNVVEFDAFKAGLRERLGVTDAALDDTQLLAAVDEVLGEQETPTATNTIPEGAVVVDAAALAALQSDARDGREARAEQVRSKREGIVTAAVQSGRIAPAAREGWLASLEKDEDGVSALLMSLPENTIPVVEMGHSDTSVNPEDALYAAVYGSTEKEA
ncbi:head maturation protease, ClpP-related [Pseudoclavibacter helvolus]|uniref:head maturation protease, ClpP-related n=1 Tax=Pseudoclavibacter helvolus TaxID=255205 RepID=UPI0037366BFB